MHDIWWLPGTQLHSLLRARVKIHEIQRIFCLQLILRCFNYVKLNNSWDQHVHSYGRELADYVLFVEMHVLVYVSLFFFPARKESFPSRVPESMLCWGVSECRFAVIYIDQGVKFGQWKMWIRRLSNNFYCMIRNLHYKLSLSIDQASPIYLRAWPNIEKDCQLFFNL